MESGAVRLEILSPVKVLYNGEARLVRLPGAKAPFVVLHNHAPILTALERGTVRWETGDGESQLAVAGGFAEVRDNHVTLCVETEK
ncbi:MAG: hypothetical protein J6U62_00495 [Bacteroidaceae bacterium]|jgi:F-type H+-transporting ATPase subunit epsilon|nr:hypothetical protein [Bacteroidaceae bacterium]